MLKLPAQFHEDRSIVCIQGLGFVGAAMALVVANARDIYGKLLYNVIGVDVTSEEGEKKAKLINKGVFPFKNSDAKLERIQKEVYQNGNLWATTNPEYFKYAEVVVVDINLDVFYTKEYQPFLKMESFKSAMHTVGQYISEETLVLVETTVPPGTCEKIVYPILMEEFEKRNMDKKRILLSHSYERVMPGEHYFDSIVNFWRVYSGIDEVSADRCKVFLESIIHSKEYPLSRLQNTTASETAKVLENSYRAVNIAFIEEWGRFSEEIGIDLFEVIDAIRVRPTHSNMRQPGFGVGGYCLTKDPYFAPLAAKEIFGLTDMDFPFSTNAVQINRNMPLVSLNKIKILLGGNLQNKRLLILGVSYRQDVGDTRYSPTEIFVRKAKEYGAEIVCQDPLVDYWPEMEMKITTDIPDFTGFHAVIFAVPHKQYLNIDFKTVVFDEGTYIFDANCVLCKEQRMDILELKNVYLSGIGRG